MQEWTERTDKQYIVDKLHQNYTESIETKQKSLSGIILKLEQWLYPYNTLKWLSKHKTIDGRKILKQNHQMGYIRQNGIVLSEKEFRIHFLKMNYILVNILKK